MLRILAFFLVVLAAGIGFAWLADHPGEVSLLWQGAQVQTSFMVFVIAEAVLVLAILILAWLIWLFFKTPGALGRYFSSRRRERGYKALSTGILAAGAGDPVLARRMTKRSEKLLGARKEPLIRFLDAQTAMIEGDHTRARSVFEQMERDPETRLLALRGLFLEAERLGDDAAARHYAERAIRLAPHVPWAGGALLEAKAAEGDWDGALSVLAAQNNSRLIDGEESKRLRAVLLTAKAMTVAEGDPATAKSAAVEAQKLAPSLAPAAVMAAQALFRLGDLRKGSKVLERSWVEDPHPEIAEAYVHARPGDSASDRLKRAKVLQDLRPTHVESSLCVARAALDARELDLARKEAMAAIEMEPRESAYLLMADIEEEETGEIGRVREWLARAIRAPRDPAWTADGFVSETWAPVSPVTGRLDAFRWKAPADRPRGDPVIEAAEGAKAIEASHPPEAHARPDDIAARALADSTTGTGGSFDAEPGATAVSPQSGYDAPGGGNDVHASKPPTSASPAGDSAASQGPGKGAARPLLPTADENSAARP